MAEPLESTTEPATSHKSVWLWILLLLVFLLVVGTALYVFQSLRSLPIETVNATANKTTQVITNVGRTLVAVAEAFQQRKVEVTLDSTGTEMESTKRFQFRKLRQTEIFTHTDHAVTGFGYLTLPDVIVEARAPVDYTYYLDLNAPWHMVLEEGVVNVFTPEIRFNRPAIDVSRVEYVVRQDSLLRDSSQAMENLKRIISSLAYLKASENIKLVRQGGKEPVEEFVSNWLLNSYSDGSNYNVRVFFPGDTIPTNLQTIIYPPAEE